MPKITERWKIVSPVGTVNYCLNPSAEGGGNYSALNGATVTRSTSYAKYGLYSFRVQTGSNGQGISLALSALPSEPCYATVRIRGRLPVGFRFIIGSGLKTPSLLERIDVNWNLYGVMFNAAECSGQTELRIVQVGNGLGDFYCDGCQVENNEFWTSFCDGDQPGCFWNGSPHVSTSTRSEKSKAGGQVKDLFADYNFFVTNAIGTGTPAQDLVIDEYALLPGGELNETKIHTREWSLIGRFIADSEVELYQSRQALIKLLRKDNRRESTKFLFYHPQGIREIKAYYAGGLEADMSTFYDSWVTEDDDKWEELNKYIEKAAIQLKSTDPFFYKQGNKAAIIDPNDSATFRIIAGRLRDTGQWSNLGPPGAPGTAVYTAISAIAEDSNYLYLGGDFQNFDNQANCDYICRYNKQTGVYSPMGTGAVGDVVLSIVVMPNGDVIAGGGFTSMGGVANTRYIAKWNPTTGAWSSIGTANDFVWALALYGTKLAVAGDFTSIGGTAANRIALWDGANYSALGSGLDDTCRALAVWGGTLYAGGKFLNAGGAAAQYVAQWDGSAWDDLQTGMNNHVYGLAVTPDGKLYATGLFTAAGGQSASRAAVWNGSAWVALGSGLNNTGLCVAVGKDNIVYFGGQFTTAGGIALADRIARWNGYAWAHLDIDLPGTPTVWAILASKFADPVIPQKYSLYLGFSTTGTGYFAGIVTVDNEGSTDTHPRFVIYRDGGTDVTLESIQNETTGRQLLFDYDLANGEALDINLVPMQAINSSAFGVSEDAILAASDRGTFVLEPGDNTLSLFASWNIALYMSEVTCWLEWREIFESFD